MTASQRPHMDIAAWLRKLGLERYTQAFENNDVDAITLPQLTEADLLAIGVKSVGHRRKLVDAIAQLHDGCATAEPSAAATAAPLASATQAPDAAPIGAEHRQLTVLYCAMVGRSLKGPALPPEQMRELIQAFYRSCARVVAEFDGYVANFFGDCILAYYGWPRAHEDDAERAVRAGLALVQRLGATQALTAHVGIGTGPVVVGELLRQAVAQEQSAIGLTPNLAARILRLAAPGQVAIDELTRRLLAPSFALRPLGRHVLKGIAEPVSAYEVIAEQAADSRFDARKGPDLAPMVGREQELALLLERWSQAQEGEGQAVLLAGEAGIGKSRLVRALLDAPEVQPHLRIVWQCSPYHTGSALWPVIQRLVRSAGLHEQDSPDVALDKLEALTGRDDEASALYATLLGLNGSQRYGPLTMTSQMLRARTLELLVEQLFERAGEQGLLLVVEDAHWIDPTTLELVEGCLERIDAARMLILVTSRPENQAALGAHTNVTQLSLNRLGRASMEAIVAHVGGASLPPQMRGAIVAQAEGVPLFAEELTKAVLESGEGAIPASLHGSLMARLDHVGEAKEVAQIAACIGRDFEEALLRSVAERPETVTAALDKLTDAEIVLRRGDRSNPHFSFKHVLVQEAVYESLLRNRRQRIHARILEVLATERPGTPADILAHHATHAGQADRAIGFWSQAGQISLDKSAYAECATYTSRAIELLRTQPDTPDRRASELELQFRLGLANLAHLGFPAQKTRQALMRADELLGEDHEQSCYYQVQYGLWAGQITRAELGDALQLARKTLGAAQAARNDEALLLAHRLIGTTHMYRGEFDSLVPHFEQALKLFDPRRERSGLSRQISVDPGAAIHCCYGFSLAILGCPDRSRAMLERAREVAAGLGQASARAYTFYWLGITGAILRDPGFTLANAEIAAELSTRHRLHMYRGMANILLGCARLESVRAARDALPHLERGIGELAAMDLHVFMPLYLAWKALALAAGGCHADAQHTMALAFEENDTRPQGCVDAELWRIRGVLALHRSASDAAEAADCFERAMKIARMRGAMLWELRAATSLARLQAGWGEVAKARQLLAPVYDRFTEGFDSTDLVEACALLGDLGRQEAPADRN